MVYIKVKGTKIIAKSAKAAVKQAKELIGYEECWKKGKYDDYDCNLCPYSFECSAAKEE